MMTVSVKRVSNPHKRRSAKKRNGAKRRRNMTAKQIRHFGTKRQKAALKTRRANPKRKSVKRRNARPRVRVVTKVVTRRRRVKRAASNPAHLLTLGALNPRRVKRSGRKKGNSTMAKRRRKASRKNAKVVVISSARHHRRRRSSNPRRRRAVSVRRRRRSNPGPFTAATGKMVLGGLIGVTVVKMVPAMLPIPALTGSPIMRVVTSVGVAWGAHEAAKKFLPSMAESILFGGLMQAGSVLLNAFLPSVGKMIGLQGFVGPASFPVPQNPLRLGVPAMAPAGVPSGMSRAFPRAF